MEDIRDNDDADAVFSGVRVAFEVGRSAYARDDAVAPARETSASRVSWNKATSTPQRSETTKTRSFKLAIH